jgi:hypothetical protein
VICRQRACRLSVGLSPRVTPLRERDECGERGITSDARPRRRESLID